MAAQPSAPCRAAFMGVRPGQSHRESPKQGPVLDLMLL